MRGPFVDDVSLALGGAGIETTQRYQGLQLNLDNAAPDRVGL
jgi:hypothetical protein